MSRSFVRLVASPLLLATLLAAPVAYLVFRSAPRPPETPTELIEVLRQSHPALYVVPANGSNPRSGIYISDHPLSRDQLVRLIRQPQYADLWNGVVHCQRYPNGSPLDPPDMSAWGEHGLRAGPLVFFGDPRLLEEIAPIVGAEGT